METHYVNPLHDLGELLLTVEKPDRYIGGEYGLLAKKEAPFQTIIAFPDLYEIGMSNNAMRILYNSINRIEGISCDRVFAVAPDFESLLRKRNIPLYGLETGISLKSACLIMFTLGYELGITNVLNMLDLGGIPIRSADRKEEDPIVIMGGPCVSNPLPYSAFIDCFWIGEAEGGFFELLKEVRNIKGRGGERQDRIKKMLSHPSVWGQGKKEAVRAIDLNFGTGEIRKTVFPVPVMKVIQHHGAVEIMRGCANGCRFCHAGFWYRPMRQKNASLIQEEAAAFINEGGYREISLSSLSTGDYCGLGDLVDALNHKYKKRNISFQLPSLKVSSFSLGLLEKISEVRKSGLTFAVETPEDYQQLSINKTVTLESVIAIIREAKKIGWRGAKFYFMIGLPLDSENSTEAINNGSISYEDAIVNFVLTAAKETGMHFNINLGTFVPKPHTPYQWAGQLDEDAAFNKMNYIRERLKKRGHKVGIQDPFISVIEGIFSRGDESIGALIEEAWKQGCRLDAWTEYLKRDTWRELLLSYKTQIDSIMQPRDINSPSPWDFINSGISKAYIKIQNELSLKREITLPCEKNCTHPCGLCNDNKKVQIVKNIIQPETTMKDNKSRSNTEFHGDDSKNELPNIVSYISAKPSTGRIIFSFCKEGSAVFYSHLAIMELFSMAFTRAAIPVACTKGFNPLPVMEIVSPLAVGILASNEIAMIELITQSLPLGAHIDPETFLERMNSVLVSGIRINKAIGISVPFGEKKHSLSSRLWGSLYEDQISNKSEYILFKEEKKYRLDKIARDGSLWGLRRLEVLARNPNADEDTGISFFETFGRLYP
ncbi:MAG: TIGR03936 family radical SAM-associated protein [Treponema sp.]|jgi:radical SAM-linked protein|nr:TIGR03936 family radical SAM-associated protein [Treponema sp.]